MTVMPLDDNHIEQAALWAAGRLADEGVARVTLTPGDMTKYPILVVAPGPEWDRQQAERTPPGVTRVGRSYWVALCCNFGSGYFWDGGEIDPGYAAEKFTPAGSHYSEHTGRVVAAFLTELSKAIAEQRADEEARS